MHVEAYPELPVLQFGIVPVLDLCEQRSHPLRLTWGNKVV
jgi:hypothetical protein